MSLSYLDTVSSLLIGLVFAGAVLQTIGLFTYEKIGFALFYLNGARGWLAAPLLLMTGPMIILRDLWDQEEGALPEVWVALWAVAALGWGVASGHVLIRIITLVHAAGEALSAL